VAGPGLQRESSRGSCSTCRAWARLGRFLAGFAARTSLEFLAAGALRETWQTVAIATAGLTLALLGAIPATLIVTERLSI
jgi:phosphonate transport system permease protein